VLVVTAFIVTGCSGGDGAAPTTPPTAIDATVPVDTGAPDPTPPPSVTVPPPPSTTTLAPTTPPPTTAPSTSVTTSPPSAPSTLPFDFGELNVALPSVMTQFVDEVNALNRDPANAALRAAVERVASGQALERVLAGADEAVSSGELRRPDPSDPSRVEPRPDTVSQVADRLVAAMTGCIIDTDSLVRLGSDGTETIAEATPDSYRADFTFAVVEGRWVVVSVAIDEHFEDQVGCA
jgi:hypothetical protein